jgi:hypothetical protein
LETGEADDDDEECDHPERTFHILRTLEEPFPGTIPRYLIDPGFNTPTRVSPIARAN